MGAETYRHRLKFRRNIYVVKLNNPLMGTEIALGDESIRSVDVCLLN